MNKIVAAAVVAFFGAMTLGVGISNADTIPVEGTFATQTACLNEGTRYGQVRTPILPRYLCEQHNDGLWYLYLIK